MKKSEKQTRLIFREGRHVYLRPQLKSDIPYLLRWLNEYEVIRHMLRTDPLTEAQMDEAIATSHTKVDRKVVTVVLKGKTPGQDRPIGWMSIFDINRVHGTAITGTCIGEKEFQGKGYATEAKMLFLWYIFDMLNLRKIYSEVYPTNLASLAYSDKCGYVEEARLPKDKFREGKFVDTIILAVYADTWRELWEKTKHMYLPK